MILSLLKKKNSYFGTRTFTYYLPSPPVRKSGYQEKEFDTLIQEITQLGFDILNIQTSSHACENKSGIWIVCLLGAKTKEAFEQKLNYGGTESAGLLSQEVPLDPDIIHD